MKKKTMKPKMMICRAFLNGKCVGNNAGIGRCPHFGEHELYHGCEGNVCDRTGAHIEDAICVSVKEKRKP